MKQSRGPSTPLSADELQKLVERVQRTAKPASRYLRAKFAAEGGLASAEGGEPADAVEEPVGRTRGVGRARS